jgi:hypothetical protein
MKLTDIPQEVRCGIQCNHSEIIQTPVIHLITESFYTGIEIEDEKRNLGNRLRVTQSLLQNKSSTEGIE